MTDSHSPRIAAVLLVVGALLGMAGSFAPSAAIRGLAWGVDGTALIAGAVLLSVHHVRRGQEVVAAGFLVFAVGEGLIVSSSAMDLTRSIPSFGAGIALWSASFIMISGTRVMPVAVRVMGVLAAVLLAAVALQIFMGRLLNPLSRPLPFFAYPLMAATLFGWAWTHYRGAA